MRGYFVAQALFAVLTLWLTPGVRAQTVMAEPSALRWFTIQVNDQFGQPTLGAQVTIRDKSAYQDAHRYVTDITGCVAVRLNPASWYVVEINYSEFGSSEFWCYGYVQEQDWSSGPSKIFRRQDPWLDQVEFLGNEHILYEPIQVQIAVTHAYPKMNYDLRVRVRMLVDDNEQTPYLDEQLSDVQVFRDGLEPFTLSYTPADPGDLHIRLQIERKWEENAWVMADDGGWQWMVIVAAPSTSTPEPTSTRIPQPTIPQPTIPPSASPTSTSESGRVLWLPLMTKINQ
jgi:hypothetical protein